MVEMKVDGSFRTPARKSPVRGELLPDVALTSAAGRQVRLSEYQGRSNLVLILAGGMDDENLLRLLDEVAGRSSEFTGEETQVIVILLIGHARKIPSEGREGWLFVFLADREGSPTACSTLLTPAGQLSLPSSLQIDMVKPTLNIAPKNGRGRL